MNEFTKEELENEIWKDIPEYEGIYQVSDLGRVKSLNYKHTKEERVLKPGIGTGGYYTVCLYKNGKKKNRTVHQLVAIVFLNHVPCGHLIEVNHKDEDKSNNRLINLEILTHEEHVKFTHRNATSKYTGVSFYKSKNKWQARITIKGKKKNLGYFDTEIEAHEARKKTKEMAEQGDLSFMKFRENSSKYIGVSFYQASQKWKAYITINGQLKHLGLFHTELEAHETYQKALENLNQTY